MAPGRHLQGEEKVQVRGTVREGVAAVPNSLRHSVWAVTTMEGEGAMSNRLSHILGHLELPRECCCSRLAHSDFSSP